MFQGDSIYREAVMHHSPGLPRLAATLGTELWNGRNPIGVVTAFLATLSDIVERQRHKPVWGCHLLYASPRVAAKSGNPGLCSVTASRYPLVVRKSQGGD
jgi:hypothetical protein